MILNCVSFTTRIRFAALATLVVAVVVAMPIAAEEPSQSGSSGKTVAMPQRGISAHRGASATHPENTLAAFREAVRLGAHQIELDVYLARDGSLVVMHDATVDRTTNGSGPIAALTLQEIKKLDAGSWKGQAFAGQRVPTLAEALEIMPRNIWLNLHLKGGAETGVAVAKEVVRQGRQHQAFLAAGHQAADAARRVNPNILICNMHNQGHDAAYVTDTIERRDQFIQFWKGFPAEQDMARTKAAGVRVNYCCTNDPNALKRLFETDVDFPLVDDVEPMVKAAKEAGVEPNRPVYDR